MIRRLLTTALCLGIGASLGTPMSAEAAPPVRTVEVPPALGPNASDLIAVADGQYLFADGSIYDSAGLVDVVDEVVGAELAEFTGDEVVLTRGVSGEEEVVLVDLVDDIVVIAEVPPGVRAAGVEGWVVEGVFHAWDETSWPLPEVGGIVTQQAGGRLVFGAWNNLAVLDIATQELRQLGPKGNSQDISHDGLGWQSPEQDCYWAWDEPDPSCVNRAWGPSGRRLGRDTTVSMVFKEYPLPSRFTDHKVWRNDKWIPAPAPAGVRVTACGVPSVDAVCVGSSASGRSVYVIQPDGTWRTAVALPAEPVNVLEMALAPEALYGTDSRGISTTSTPAWVRTGASLSSETRLEASGRVDASAGRGLIGRQWYEGKKPGVRGFDSAPGRDAMSGPFVLNKLHGGVFDIAGKNHYNASHGSVPIDIFGTAQLRSNFLADVSGRQQQVLAGVSGAEKLNGVWGPWVHGFEDGRGWFVRNWQTSRTAYFAKGALARIWGIGDGIVVTHDADQGRFQVFDSTDLSKPLAARFTFDGTPHSIDRNRLAWTTPEGDIRVSTFPFGGGTAPMLLGLTDDPIGRSPSKAWTPAFDFSAPLAKGRIVVKNQKGVVVHTLDTPASGSGSLRLSWNMSTKDGKALPSGAYTWELVVKDPAGRQATRVDQTSAVTGVLTVGPVVKVVPLVPRYEVPCGGTQPQWELPTMLGITYQVNVDGPKRVVTAVADPGFVISGTSRWEFTTPTVHPCTGTAPAPKFIDKPGTANDRVVIPASGDGVTGYTINGFLADAGTHVADPGPMVVRAEYWNEAMKPSVWRHTFLTSGAPATTPPTKPQDPYSETGEYLINGRKWRTTCEPYSITRRCRTEIWGTQTKEVNGRFVSTNGWTFNNLTYLASPRAAWKGNPLGMEKTWTADDGRQWRTECDTALTGSNGCRSFVKSRVIEAKARVGGGYTYSWQTREVFNNMVRFS